MSGHGHHIHHHAHHLAHHGAGLLQQLSMAWQHPNAHPQVCFYSGVAVFVLLLLLFYSPILGWLIRLTDPGMRGSLDRVGGSGMLGDVALPMLMKIVLGGATGVAVATFVIAPSVSHLISAI